MKVLVTGAAGFVGRNLKCTLESIRDGKGRSHPGLSVSQVYLCGRDTEPALLEEYCRRADFVFHLAGVNRAADPAEFWQGNVEFSAVLLDMLKKHGNTCPVMLASSVHAGQEAGEYAASKLAAEELFLLHGAETGAKVLIYRLPNLFGKWCRPDYNSVAATFCHNSARGLPITVNDPSAELEMVYIDDLVEELLLALEGREHRVGGGHCAVPCSYRVTVGELAELVSGFGGSVLPELPAGSFAGKLYAVWLSCLPVEQAALPLKRNEDDRGSFTELLRTRSGGQLSVNVTGPGATRGQHWHHSKWEIFTVVSGRGLIRMRQVGSDRVTEFPVSAEKPTAVYMLPGYTHSITNLSDTHDLVTVIWAGEIFDPARPDTCFEEV